MYYFINKETRELVVAIIYINDICFIGSKDSLLLRVKVKIYDEMRIL